MEPLIAALPLIAAAIVPPIVAVLREQIVKLVPSRWFPVLLPIGGGILAGIANLLGVDAAILQTTATDVSAWNTVITGIVSGSAAVGIHQVGKQLKKPA